MARTPSQHFQSDKDIASLYWENRPPPKMGGFRGVLGQSFRSLTQIAHVCANRDGVGGNFVPYEKYVSFKEDALRVLAFLAPFPSVVTFRASM